MFRMMKMLDLFSGIGGFSLAASWTGCIETVAFCEIDPFCQKILKKHWPDVPVYSDITKLKGEDFEKIDIITGGFPCQPFSLAGKRKGTADDRHLWPEMLRIISEVKPTWVIAENVYGLLSQQEGVVFENCCLDLENQGYEVQPFIIPACAINAPHRRDRVWIVAHTNTPGSGTPTGRTHSNGQKVIEEQQLVQFKRGGQDSNVTDTRDTGLQGGERTGTYDKGQTAHGSVAECNSAWDESWLEVAQRLCKLDDGLSTGLVGYLDMTNEHLQKRNEDRTKKLKALGNAIVPQVVYQIMMSLLEVRSK